MSSKGSAVTVSFALCTSADNMSDFTAKATLRDRKLSSPWGLPNYTNLDDNCCFPSVFSSPYTKSTVCSFLLAFPTTSHAHVPLSTLAFLSITANIKPSDVSRNCEDQLSVSTGNSLASALETALQTLLYCDKPSFQLPNKLKKIFRLPTWKQTRRVAVDKMIARSDETAIKNSGWPLEQKGKVQGLKDYSLNARVSDDSILDPKHVVIATAGGLDGEGELHDPERVQNGSNSSAESVGNITKHLMAGAISTIVARTFVAPLERLKLEYIVCGAKHNWVEVIQGIWFTEGLGGFWKGNVLNLLRMVPFKSINFLAYDMFCKEILVRKGKDEATNSDRLTAGAASGAAATLLCFPLDTLRTRLIAPGGEELGGMVGCFQHMIHKEGVFSLYKGLFPALLSMVPSGAVFYGVYDILKAAYIQSPAAQKELQRRIVAAREAEKASNFEIQVADESGKKSSPQVELGPVRTLVYGAIAGACAEVVTYPLEVVRRQLQLQQTTAKMGLIAAFQGIVERDGLRALFAGVVPSTIQVLPSASLSYLVFEFMKSVMKVA